ncbi:MAG TPA: hypothetical protein PLE55_06755, partial [Clostridiales bacterium]|nr:hypothetical protein [Clostridiales bacterium]
AHTGEVSGAHQGTAIAVDSSGFTGNLKLADDTVQKALATLDALAGLPATNAITKIYGDDDVVGSDTGAVWLVGTNDVSVTRTGNTFEISVSVPPSATATEDIGTYIESNTTWEFDTTYDTTAVCIYRNRLLQPRKLFTSSVVSGKTRVTFLEPINASDEIILISNK